VYIRYALVPEAAVLVAISHENRDPLYKQVTDQLRDAVARGRLAPGVRLPSVRVMARELGVSPITVKRAYADLERDGWIVTRAGLGSFAAGTRREALRRKKAGEIREEIKRIIRTAGSYGIPIAEIRRIVDDVKARQR
jgi:GntR family transcriptional regulator